MQIPLDLRAVLSAGEAGLKRPLVQLDAASKFQQAGPVEFIGVSEQEVMILPKFSLLAGATGRLGAQFRLTVHPAQRKISVRQADFAAVFGKQVLQSRLELSAKRTLEV